jgi:hypothetical protein
MAKPTEKELDIAIQMAIQMREKNKDPFHLAQCLLSHNFRMKHLEDVLQKADRYINMGMAEHERSQLIRAIEKAKDIESYTSQQRDEPFGLE